MCKALATLLALTIFLSAGAQTGLPLRSFGLAGVLAADSLPSCRVDAGPDLGAVWQHPFDLSIDSLGRRMDEHTAGRTFWLRFALRNLTDSPQDLFIRCGDLDYLDAWFVSADTVHVSAGELRAVAANSTPAQRFYTALPLHLPPRAKGTVYLAIRQIQPTFSFDGVLLYSPNDLDAAWAGAYREDQAYYVFQWLFQGFLLCQLLYVFFQWLIIRRKEYLYYFCYLVVITLYFLNKFESVLGIVVLFSRFPLLKVYLAKTLLIFPYFLYVRFVRSFLDLPHRYPGLNRWIKWVEYFLLAYTVFDLALGIWTLNPRLQTEFFTYILLVLFLLTTSFTVYLFLHRETLTYYILTGSLAVGIGNILGQVFTYVELYKHIDLGIDHILVFPQVGILLEILCFTAGLGHKNQAAEKDKLLSQANLIEQLKANELLQNRMQHIRNKIAQDLHDDIGSTLSSISILSDLALRDRVQTLETMSEIKDSAILLMERMDDIVWSINPRNDSLEHLLMRVRHFATTLFEATGIEYDISIQKNIDAVRLPTDFRQHVYLILKEAINNLVKYAGATRAEIQVGFEEGVMALSVRDNGKGFEPERPGQGNGLPGMRRRAETMGASLRIASAPGNGTEVVLRVALG
jgi:signal transduction histidine kinase